MSDAITSRLYRRYIPPAVAPDGTVCRVVRIPDDPTFIWAVNELLSTLAHPDAWRDEGIGRWPAAWIGAEMFNIFREESCEVVGQVVTHALETLPDNWLWCDGATHNRVDYPKLYAALHPNFRLNADTFKTPDLNLRMSRGIPSGFNTWAGLQAGTETHTLTVSEMPQHAHEPAFVGDNQFALYDEDAGGLRLNHVVGGTFRFTPGGGLTTRVAGLGQAHNNMPPYTWVFYAIVAK